LIKLITVISFKPRDKSPNQKLSCQPGPDRSDRSNLSQPFLRAPLHLNHTLSLTDSFPPHRVEPELELSPSPSPCSAGARALFSPSPLTQTLEPKSFLSIGFQGRGRIKSVWGIIFSLIPSLGSRGFKVFARIGAHSRYLACHGRSLVLDGFRRFPPVEYVLMDPRD